MDNLSLITVTNQFDRTSRDHQLVPYKGETLLGIRNEYFPAEINFSVAINGQIIPENQLALTIPVKGDCVVFTSRIEYVGGIVAAVATFVAELVVASAPYWVTFLVYYGTYALVYGAIMIGAGLLINALFSADTPTAGDQNSQLYSWNPVTTNKQGGSVPKMYGESIVYGNVITVYTETIDDLMHLNILVCVNLGPINKVSSFKINDQDSGLFNGVTFETRYGYIDQPAILNFNDTKVEYSMARLVKHDTPEEYVTATDDFDKIEVDVSFLKGLYHMSDEGSIGNQNVKVKIEAVYVEDPSIVVLLTHDVVTDSTLLPGTTEARYQPDETVTYSHWSLGIWIRGLLGLVSVWRELANGSTVYTDHKEGEVVFMHKVVDAENGESIYIVYAKWRWLEAGLQVNTTTTFLSYAICSGDSTSKVTKTFSSPVPKKGKYTIRVIRVSEDTSDTKIGSEMSLSCVRLVYNDDFSYPRHALVGIKALASDQLSGNLGFSCTLEGSLIRVYGSGVWTVEYNNNPAWVCFDILTQPVFNDPSLVYVKGAADDDFDFKWFRCKLSHTAASNNVPLTGANYTTYWELAENPVRKGTWDSAAPSYFGTWGAGNHYLIGECKFNDSVAYKCVIDHFSAAESEPGVGATWQAYWVNYLDTLEYFTDDYVVKSDNRIMYRCILGHMWDASKEPGTSGGALYWEDKQYYYALGSPAVACAYVDITDSGVVRYDGINPSKLDYLAFKEWADWCDVMVDNGAGGTEKRFEFNGGFDSEASLWEQAIKVCVMSRAMLYWNGNQISVIIDRAGTPVQLFSVGNIIIDSFEEAFLPYEDRAGEIEIDFINKDNNYQRDTFTIFNTTINKPTNKVAVQLLGCTSPSQAWRTGQFLLLCNQYLKRTITFKADIDAIACTIGDIINFQHDLPRWGLAGGRLVSATVNTITLDTEVTIESGKTYAITIRLNTDVIVTKTISTSTPGVYSQLSVSVPFVTIPSQYDVYSFGESEIVTKPFRVQSIERSQDTIMTISCLEYNENVYTVDTGEPVVPDIDYTPYDPISPVTDLLLSELVYFDKSGAVVREIAISFKKPNNVLYKEAIIYYIKNGAPMVQAGVTTDTKFKINGCALLDVYYVYICSRSWSGVTLNQSQWVSATITISLNSPDVTYITDYIVSGLEIYNQGNSTEFTGKDCKFVWNDISNVIVTDVGAGEEEQGAGSSIPGIWFKDYEVQIYDIYGTLRRTEYVTSPEYTYTYEKNCEDSSDSLALYTFQIRVKARDMLGHISATAAMLTVTNSVPNSVENLQALPVISGVCFTWNKSTDTDFNCYYVRTAVESVYGDWKKVTDNAHTRSLSDAEMVLYGATALITIDVQAMDVFEQVSESESVSDNAATISDNLFQFTATKSGGVGNVSDLYDGKRTIFVDPGVTI